MEWIAVSDKLPNDGDVVFGVAARPDGSFGSVAKMKYYRGSFCMAKDETWKIIAWMPIPPVGHLFGHGEKAVD